MYESSWKCIKYYYKIKLKARNHINDRIFYLHENSPLSPLDARMVLILTKQRNRHSEFARLARTLIELIL